MRQCCEGAHSIQAGGPLHWWSAGFRGSPVSKDRRPNDSASRDRDAFDPDRVILDDVDELLAPRLSLIMDTQPGIAGAKSHSADHHLNGTLPPPSLTNSGMSIAGEHAHTVEVAGGERRLWHKIRAYLGF